MSRADFGQKLARALNVRHARTFGANGAADGSGLQATLIRQDVADYVMTSPIIRDDALLVMLQLRDWPTRYLWRDGRQMPARPLQAGAFSIFDLRHVWVGYRVCPIHQLNVYLPRSALEAVCKAQGRDTVTEFSQDPCEGTSDGHILRLAQALLPAFEHPEEAGPLFVEAVTGALAAHLVHTYGVQPSAQRNTPRLDGTAVSRAKELVEAGAMLAPLADEYGLSVDTFNRAFGALVGSSPTRWLLERRIERAQILLCQSHLPLADVAARSGFSGVHHMERVFRRIIGLTPSAWRRAARH